MSRLMKLTLDGVIGMCFLTGMIHWLSIIIPWIKQLLSSAT